MSRIWGALCALLISLSLAGAQQSPSWELLLQRNSEIESSNVLLLTFEGASPAVFGPSYAEHLPKLRELLGDAVIFAEARGASTQPELAAYSLHYSQWPSFLGASGLSESLASRVDARGLTARGAFKDFSGRESLSLDPSLGFVDESAENRRRPSAARSIDC